MLVISNNSQCVDYHFLLFLRIHRKIYNFYEILLVFTYLTLQWGSSEFLRDKTTQ